MCGICSTITGLVKKNDVFTKRWLKTMLKIKRGEHIMFTVFFGKPNVV